MRASCKPYKNIPSHFHLKKWLEKRNSSSICTCRCNQSIHCRWSVSFIKIQYLHCIWEFAQYVLLYTIFLLDHWYRLCHPNLLENCVIIGFVANSSDSAAKSSLGGLETYKIIDPSEVKRQFQFVVSDMIQWGNY